MDKTEVSRLAILLVGVILLVFVFFNAYLFLQKDLSVVSTSGLEGLFGEALGPLIEACIRVMYLGIMGWIGSIVTIRGVQLLTSSKPEVEPETVPKVEPLRETKGKKNK